jgi:hypothetical protein
MPAWDIAPTTNLAAPTADFSALGEIIPAYKQAQQKKKPQPDQQQPQSPYVGATGPQLPINPATGKPDYTAAPMGFFQAGNFPGLASMAGSGLTAFGNSVGNFLLPGGIGSPT